VNEAAATPPAETLRALIAARQKRSISWRVIHLLGSLKLALLLLATIAIACAVATVFESRFDARIARAAIYKAPWFLVWLGVLCVNLFAVTLTRWPWQRKHAGFIITHYGIITLLAGAVIGSIFGFEGNVTLHAGSPPVSRVTTSRTIVQVENPARGAISVVAFDPAVSRPSEKNPRLFAVPGSDLKILADASSDRLVRHERIIPGRTGAPAAVLLHFQGRMASSDLDLAIPADGGRPRDFFGLARIAFLDHLPPPPPPSRPESQIVFARFAPVIQPVGDATGTRVTLSADGGRLTVTDRDGTAATFDRAGALGTPLRVGASTVTVREYWPDFVMKGGLPSSASDRPDNPAILVQVTSAPGADASIPLLEMAPSAGDPSRFDYRLSRGGEPYASGSVARGEAFSTGWADWRVEVREFLPRAEVSADFVGVTADARGGAFVSGFRVRLERSDGRSGDARWVGPGSMVPLVVGADTARIGYGLEARPLPFSIGLKKFEVPRNEGTQTPSNFIATVEFIDPRTGVQREGTARMNHPASFPGTPWANFTGFNYKFSQAEWNPLDLGETTLQVLYDPGWMLKWIGSLAICLGIALMFYFRPQSKPRDP